MIKNERGFWNQLEKKRDIMNSIEIFEKHAQEYDEWFDENKSVHKSESIALKDLIPKKSGRLGDWGWNGKITEQTMVGIL